MKLIQQSHKTLIIHLKNKAIVRKIYLIHKRVCIIWTRRNLVNKAMYVCNLTVTLDNVGVLLYVCRNPLIVTIHHMSSGNAPMTGHIAGPGRLHLDLYNTNVIISHSKKEQSLVKFKQRISFTFDARKPYFYLCVGICD